MTTKSLLNELAVLLESNSMSHSESIMLANALNLLDDEAKYWYHGQILWPEDC